METQFFGWKTGSCDCLCLSIKEISKPFLSDQLFIFIMWITHTYFFYQCFLAIVINKLGKKMKTKCWSDEICMFGLEASTCNGRHSLVWLMWRNFSSQPCTVHWARFPGLLESGKVKAVVFIQQFLLSCMVKRSSLITWDSRCSLTGKKIMANNF